jgi:hypothetical protein
MIQRAQTHCIGASNDPRYPYGSVFCFGFRAYFVDGWERRRDVLHGPYVTKSGPLKRLLARSGRGTLAKNGESADGRGD